MSAPTLAAENPVRAAMECLAVLVLMSGIRFGAHSLGFTRDVGSVSIVLALILLGWLLARRGAGWRSLGLSRPADLGRAAAWAFGTFVAIMLMLPTILGPISERLALAPQHIDRLGDLQGSTLRYLVLLIPIGWGAAAFGEELVYRGFLNARLTSVFGGGLAAAAVAALCQALLFGLAHAYLGPRGVLNASAIGLVSAGVFLADGRNLWPLIVAHGLVDTVGLTLIRFGVGHG